VASINFPNSPGFLEVFTDPLTDNTYVWNGDAWVGYAYGGINRDSFWGRGVVGIHTVSYVGIGITRPEAQLHVVGDTIFDGNVTITGILTATVIDNSNFPVGLTSRTLFSQQIDNIEHLDTELYQFDAFKSFALLKIQTSSSAWVRIYTDSDSRSKDIATRSLNEDPIAGSGVIAEAVTREFPFGQIFSPYTLGGNMDDPPTSTIYAAATNLCGITTDLTVTISVLRMEV
jgi:hypothetical protein